MTINRVLSFFSLQKPNYIFLSEGFVLFKPLHFFMLYLTVLYLIKWLFPSLRLP